LHRFKADEAYQIGSAGEPIKSYLNIPALIELCLEHEVDAIHPGYGFLSENPELAKACEENGIIFVGPTLDTLQRLGDKTSARQLAKAANVPVLSGTDSAITDAASGLEQANSLGYPLILKASHGGGGRGMRVVRPEVRQALCDAAISIGKEVGYQNAGTVEFLVDADTNKFYFIEVNPRVQVEHTVTEEVTGVDIVKSQILVAQGLPLADEAIGLASQDAIETNGFALQCRITTEDPTNNFMPDYGRVMHYRSPGGAVIQLSLTAIARHDLLIKRQRCLISLCGVTERRSYFRSWAM